MSGSWPLGEATPYPKKYDPGLLVGIERADPRRAIGLRDALPFSGVDIWNAYELSWLDSHGLPRVATATMRVPSDSPAIVESKSFKLYLNSLNGERYPSSSDVKHVIATDLTEVLGVTPDLEIAQPKDLPGTLSVSLPFGACLDDRRVEIVDSEVDSGLLSVDRERRDVEETVHTNLFKSNCPVTNQPDWASVVIRYRGFPIDLDSLLRYLVSYRNHEGFHENCVERIFVDIQRRCVPKRLSVLARYTRRGGIDINPFRTSRLNPDTDDEWSENARTWRQ